MDGEEGGGGPRLSKMINDGEVDFKTKSGTAWSHSYLNQKPWHPLSYPNQRRKWIAEQTHAQRQRRNEEIAREYSQEQEFFRQTALISKKEKEKVEMMQAVSFMYVRPPGYNAESAKAAEIAEEKKKEGQSNPQSADGASSSMPSESVPGKDHHVEEKKKPRPKDVFGRPLPTEEEFEALKNAPRLDTGVQGRAKPFGIEIRNVRCVRCGNYGHQSGDRECPLKDAITPNEQSRLKRDDPLNAILAHTDPSEPLKWELKQKPGVSPPRGGFNPDDPNQQIVAEDIYDEYGGFLSGGDIPELLANLTSSKHEKRHSKKSKHKRRSSPSGRNSKAERHDSERRSKRKNKKKNKHKKREQQSSESSSSDDLDSGRHHRRRKHKHSTKSSEDTDSGSRRRRKRRRRKDSYPSTSEDSDSSTSEESYRSRRHKSRRNRHHYSSASEDSDTKSYRKGKKSRHNDYHSSEDSDSDRHRRSGKVNDKH